MTEGKAKNDITAIKGMVGNSLSGIGGSMSNLNALMQGMGNMGGLGNSLSGAGFSHSQSLGSLMGELSPTLTRIDERIIPIDPASLAASVIHELQGAAVPPLTQPGPVKAQPRAADQNIPGLDVSLSELLKPHSTPVGQRKNYVER